MVRTNMNKTAPTIAQTFPMLSAPFRPNLSLSQLAIKDPDTPPIRKTDTMTDQSTWSSWLDNCTLYLSLILSLQNDCISCKPNIQQCIISDTLCSMKSRIGFLRTWAGLFMTPKLYPAGNVDPRQQVAPPSTSNGVHPPGSASCALLHSYIKEITQIRNYVTSHVKKFSLLLSER